MEPEPELASVTVDDVRDVISVSSAEVPDSKISKMVKRAGVMPDNFSGFSKIKPKTKLIFYLEPNSRLQIVEPTINFR